MLNILNINYREYNVENSFIDFHEVYSFFIIVDVAVDRMDMSDTVVENKEDFDIAVEDMLQTLKKIIVLKT